MLYIYLINIHKFGCIHAFSLVQRREDNILWFSGVVKKGSLDGVIIMGPNGDQCSFSADVLMQFVLEVNETIIGILIELYVSQHRSYNKRSNQSSLHNIYKHKKKKKIIGFYILSYDHPL